LVSSHLLAEVEQIATHVGIMSAGRLLRQGTLTEVLSDGAAIVRVCTPDVETAARALESLGLTGLDRDLEKDEVRCRLGDTAPELVASAVVSAGARLRGLAVERPDLEDLFVSLTGEGFDVLS
jgi:ABC-2 type transport system ATP-binding protein